MIQIAMSKTFFFAFFLIFFYVTYADAQAGKNCLTPNRENAKCISIYDCGILYDVVTTKDPAVVSFLKASQCGYDKTPLVCCGTTIKFTTPSPPVTSPTGKPENHKNYNLLPDRKICGYQLFEERILRGETTGLNEYPWMALLRYRNTSGFEQFSCGGTLISSKYVLTAAHCITGDITKLIGNLVSVRLGEWNTETEKDCISSLGFTSCSEPPVNVKVQQVMVHPNYNARDNNRYNDIALIRLDKSIKYTDYVRPVCLPSSTDRAEIGEKPVVVGWGLNENYKYSPTKQKLAVPVVAASKCTPKFRDYGVTLIDSQICAGGEAGKDSCKGDSGGPLLHKSKADSSQFYIEGVVSFGLNCGNAGWPGVYTRVSSYLTWILDNIKP